MTITTNITSNTIKQRKNTIHNKLYTDHEKSDRQEIRIL